MAGKLTTPTTKGLSVILTKEHLVQGKYEDQKNSKKQLSERPPSYSVNKSTRLINKDCKVILERFDVNFLKQPVQEGTYKSKSAAKNKGISFKSARDGELENIYDGDLKSTKNLILEKLPVYKQVMEVSKERDDLYAFDEPDFEDPTAIKKTKRIKKKSKALKTLPKPRKKHKTDKFKICNTYDTAVQDILAQVMKKINNKLENKTTPNQPEICSEPNMDVQPEDALLNVGYNSDTEVNKTLQNAELENTRNMDVQPEDALLNVGGCNSDTEVNKTLQNAELENTRNNNSAFYSPLKSNKKIQIISDITLDRSDGSDDSDDSDDSFLNEDLQPNANSTVLVNEKCKPWRFNGHVKRNPHYLSVKKTGLPCLQQDMVIDHIQLKKIEEHFTKMSRKPKNLENKPSPIRESDLFCDTVDKENVPHLRQIDTSILITEEHKSQENILIIKHKRKVLGLRQQNVISNYTVRVPKNAVPEIQNQAPKLQSKEKLDRNSDTSPQEILNESENNNFAVKLFEDEEPTMKFDENSKIYIPKVRKKKKKLHDNIDETGQDKHKKEMTKKEQAELEKWAAKFNSLCEDIEKYKLEIE